MKNTLLLLSGLLFLASCSESNKNWTGCYEGVIDKTTEFIDIQSASENISYSIDLSVKMDNRGYYVKFGESKGYLDKSGRTKFLFNDQYPNLNREVFMRVEVDINSPNLIYKTTREVYWYDDLETITKEIGKLKKTISEC